MYLNMVCGKQVCLRNKKKKKGLKSNVPRVRIELTTFRFLTSDYETDALPTALTRHSRSMWEINISLNIFYFFHDSTKPKNYISLLIRVPRCFYPKENTRQTLRHILALTIYVYT